MSQLTAIQWRGRPILNITWQVSDFCNYRCGYCNPGNYSGRHRNTNHDRYLGNLLNIIDHYDKTGSLQVKLFLSGGEPSLWQSLHAVYEALNARRPGGLTVAINTNLSRGVEWWRDNHHMFDDVVASYHPTWVKHDRFLETAQFLQTRVDYLAIRMMMYEPHWDDMLRASEEIWSNMGNVWLEHVPILDEMNSNARPYQYQDPDKITWLRHNGLRHKETLPKPPNRLWIDWLDECYDDGTRQVLNSNRLVAEQRNFFRGWSCDIGYSVNIAINGDVTLATCGQSGCMGNINQELRFDNWRDSLICAKDHCHCGTDICIPKRAPHD
jgi:organic radical activating enzyme